MHLFLGAYHSSALRIWRRIFFGTIPTFSIDWVIKPRGSQLYGVCSKPALSLAAYLDMASTQMGRNSKIRGITNLHRVCSLQVVYLLTCHVYSFGSLTPTRHLDPDRARAETLADFAPS